MHNYMHMQFCITLANMMSSSSSVLLPRRWRISRTHSHAIFLSPKPQQPFYLSFRYLRPFPPLKKFNIFFRPSHFYFSSWIHFLPITKSTKSSACEARLTVDFVTDRYDRCAGLWRRRHGELGFDYVPRDGATIWGWRLVRVQQAESCCSRVARVSTPGKPMPNETTCFASSLPAPCE